MMEKTSSTARIHNSKKEGKDFRVRKTEFGQLARTPAGHILSLQRTIGNQAVLKLMNSGALQAKLSIGASGDVYEQEADRVADSVMQMPQAVSGGTPSIERACPKCETDELKRQPIKEDDEEEKLQRKQVDEEEEELQAEAISGSISEVNPDLESHIRSVRGGGKPLSDNDRAFFEPRFGQDFSQVRLIFGPNAAWENGKFLGQVNLVNIVGTKGETEQITASSFPYYINMAKDAEKENINIGLVSGFRSYPTQAYLYNGYINGTPGFDLAAKPGYSNHQNGTAFDLNTAGNGGTGTGALYNW